MELKPQIWSRGGQVAVAGGLIHVWPLSGGGAAPTGKLGGPPEARRQRRRSEKGGMVRQRKFKGERSP